MLSPVEVKSKMSHVTLAPPTRSAPPAPHYPLRTTRSAPPAPHRPLRTTRSAVHAPHRPLRTTHSALHALHYPPAMRKFGVLKWFSVLRRHCDFRASTNLSDIQSPNSSYTHAHSRPECVAARYCHTRHQQPSQLCHCHVIN